MTTREELIEKTTGLREAIQEVMLDLKKLGESGEMSEQMKDILLKQAMEAGLGMLCVEGVLKEVDNADKE